MIYEGIECAPLLGQGVRSMGTTMGIQDLGRGRGLLAFLMTWMRLEGGIQSLQGAGGYQHQHVVVHRVAVLSSTRCDSEQKVFLKHVLKTEFGM